MATIFDAIQPGEEIIYEKPDYEKKLDRKADVARGVTQGIGDIMSFFNLGIGAVQSPLTALLTEEEKQQQLLPGQEARYQREAEPGISEAEFIRRASEDEGLLPEAFTPGGRTAAIEEFENIPEGGASQEAVRRLTRTGGQALMGGGFLEPLLREGMGLAGKETAKAFGAGETGQAVADIVGSLAPIPRAGVKAPKQLQEGVDLLKKAGRTAEDITPLIAGEKRTAPLLAKVASKGERTQESLRTAKEAIGDVLTHVETRPEAKQAINPKTYNNLIEKIEKRFEKLDSKDLNAIKEDYGRFLETPGTSEDLIRFYRNINKKGREGLGILKGPIQEALSQTNKELGKDFKLANDLYSKYKKISTRLKPSLANDIIEASIPIQFLGGFITGNSPLMVAAIGEAAAKKVSQQMLTNPRYQNLASKMVSSFNSGQIKAAEKILNQMSKELSKESPEAAKELRKIEMKDLKSLLEASSQ